MAKTKEKANADEDEKKKPKRKKEKKVSLKDENGNYLHDANGKLIRKSVYGDTEKQRQKKADKWQNNYLLQEQTKNPTSDTLFSIFADRWLGTLPGTIQHSTYRGYKGKVNSLKAYFPEDTVDSMTQLKIQTFFLSLSGKALSTIKKYYIVTHAIFELARRNKLITENPCEGIRFPLTPVPEERRFYNEAQARVMIDLAKENDECGLGSFIQLKTGVRPGELLALNIERDFNFRTSILHVSHAIKEGDNYVPFEGPTKTYQERDIPFDKEFKEHIKKIIKAKKLTGYLFFTENGTPRRYEIYMEWVYGKFLEKANERILKDKKLKKIFNGCTDFTPYELRHTYGTLAYRSGTDLLTLQKVMGHKSLEVTKIYIHHDSSSLKSNLKLNY